MGEPIPDPVYREIVAHRAQRDADYLIPVVQAAGREVGYAVATHGSLRRDIDLIACPWTDQAVTPPKLVEALRHAIERAWLVNDNSGRLAMLSPADPNPEVRAHGRECWIIHLGQGVYIDLSIMPPVA